MSSRTAGGLPDRTPKIRSVPVTRTHRPHLELSTRRQGQLRGRSGGVRGGQRDGAGAGCSGWCRSCCGKLAICCSGWSTLMLGQGVRQFLDLGSGLPNMANTHQIAHRVAPEARIVYVDSRSAGLDPCRGADGWPQGVVTLRADLREPEKVLSHTQVRDLFDFGQPVGIMFMCPLHCLVGSGRPVGGRRAVPGRGGARQLPGSGTT